MFGISSASWTSKLNQYFPLAQVACFRKILKYGWSSEKCCKNSSQNWWIYSVFNLYYLYCYFRTSQRVINSDFDDDHDSPKGEVNANVLVNSNDVSDIFKHFVDEKGVSSCLKSLRKTRLWKFPCTYWPPLNPVFNRRTISLMLKFWAECLDFAETIGSSSSWRRESPST